MMLNVPAGVDPLASVPFVPAATVPVAFACDADVAALVPVEIWLALRNLTWPSANK